ncbi:MAG: 16S rRNA (guanine(966)-N(2))-methyltransferase RsmD [Beijerinckiaceae bacterium]
MRVVAGRLGGRALKTPSTDAIRPTTDRLRESLFNILAHGFDDVVRDARVLDCFAGTGALGIEAMSRGAKFCLFVEEGTEARALIRDNVVALGLAGSTRIFRRDATRLGDIGALDAFDLMFCDPPYRKGLGEEALISARDHGWLKPGALAVLEEAADADFEIPNGFSLVDERGQRETVLRFLRRI